MEGTIISQEVNFLLPGAVRSCTFPAGTALGPEGKRSQETDGEHKSHEWLETEKYFSHL